MSGMKPCDNCGYPWPAHCTRHAIPCCPHYQQHDQVELAHLDGRLLTNRQAAAYLSIHPNTMKRIADRGGVPFYRIVPRGDRRYRLTDLEEYTFR